jgi:hypothetical protein
MTRLEQVKSAIESLPDRDLNRLRKWLADKDWEKWDRELERDVAAGKLDFLAAEAREEKKRGHLGNL